MSGRVEGHCSSASKEADSQRRALAGSTLPIGRDDDLPWSEEQEGPSFQRAQELEYANQVLSQSLLTLATEPVHRAPELMLLQLARAANAVNTYWLSYDEPTGMLEVAIRIERGTILEGPTDDEPEILRRPFRADITPAFARLCADNATIRLSRSRAQDPLFPGLNEWHQRHGRTEGIAFVLKAGDRPLGLVGMGFDDREVISDVQEQLVRALAHQFLLALELTRLSNSSRDARAAQAVADERERAAAQRAQELWQAQQCLRKSALRLQTLDALDDYLLDLVRAASKLLGAEGGAFGLIDATESTLVIKDTYPAKDPGAPDICKTFEIDLRNQPHRLWRHLAEIDDYWWAEIDDPRFADSFRGYHAPQGRTQFAHFPVRVQGQPIGFLGFAFQAERRPSPTSVEVVHILTEHAAVAVQMARLADLARRAAVGQERELAANRRTHDLVLANEALKRGVARLSEDVDIGDFLDQVLAEAARHVGGRANTLFLHDSAADTLSMRRHYTVGDADREPDDTPAAVPAAGVALWSRVRNGWTVSRQLDELCLAPWAACTPSSAPLTVLAVPLIVDGRVIGFMAPTIEGSVDVPAEHVELVQALAHQATLALELTRLSDAARRVTAIQAASEERARIAGEIHDSLAQNFTAIAIQSEMLAKSAPSAADLQATLQVISRTARLGLAEARATVLTMKAVDASPGTLEQALQQLAERCTIPGVVWVTVATSGGLCPLGPESVNVALRVAQEAVTNALRHARGSRIEIQLVVLPEATRLVVRDDGIGFDVSAARRKGGFGLSSMHARAAALGACLEFSTAPEGGTQVVLQLPHAGARDAPARGDDD